jgi:hypothetical protein
VIVNVMEDRDRTLEPALNALVRDARDLVVLADG